MSDTGNLSLRDPAVAPTDKMLEQTLGGSYTAYEALQDALLIAATFSRSHL